MLDNQNRLFTPINAAPLDVAPLDVVLLDTSEKPLHQEGCACAACMDGGSDKFIGIDYPMADTVPGDTSSTATLTVGGYIEGLIDTSGDHDWYRVNLTAGQTYTFSTILLSGGLVDSILTLRDAAGTLLVTNDDVNLNADLYWSEITFTASSSGTYFLDVQGYDVATGTFYLTSTAPTADAIADSSATTASLTVGAAATSGTINANGDHDWYAVNVVAGQTYLFTTTAVGGTDVDTTLFLRNASGALLAYNDDKVGTYSQIRYVATTTGTLYLDVGAWGNAETGAYRVQAEIAPPLSVYTNDQIADQLINGYWGGPAAARHFNVTPGGTITFNVTALTAAGQNLARRAFELWSDATGVNFSEITGTANITLDDADDGAYATSTRIGNIIQSSIVNVSTDWITTYGSGLNTYSFQTYIHEIGHAIGLGHAGPYNGTADYGVDNSYLNDAWATTVMSYFDQTENTYFGAQGFTRQFVVSPIVADVLATTSMYGTPNTTRTGNTTYGFNNNSGRDIYNATLYSNVTYTVVDHGGTDTLDYSGFTQTQTINLNAEAFSSVGGRVGNVTIARGTVIENAIGGSGVDTITGNSAGNVLTGNAGADFIYGGAGIDTIFGEVGDAVLDGGADSDLLVFLASGTVTATLANFEALSLVGGVSIVMTSTQFNTGFASNSTLGGTGTLTINMDVAGNFITKLMGFGGPALTMIVNGTAGSDVFKLGNGSHTVNAGDGVDQIKGGSAADTINGGAGIDKINGAAGADILTGGAGNDVFKYANASDSGLGVNADRITDFVIGSDRLNFGKIDANAGLAGDQAFSFVGTGAFTGGGAGSIRYTTASGNIVVQVDVDGNGTADMEVILQGLAGQTLTSGDFVL